MHDAVWQSNRYARVKHLGMCGDAGLMQPGVHGEIKIRHVGRVASLLLPVFCEQEQAGDHLHHQCVRLRKADE